jgi:hypothetical protein
MRNQGGNTATFTGEHEEKRVVHYLETLDYALVGDVQCQEARKWVASGRDVVDWCKGRAQSDAVYFRKQGVAKSIYGIPWRLDFVLWHRETWPEGLFIEVKTQTVGGSVDEKLPFIVLSLMELKRPSGLLIVGDGFRECAIEWAESQCTDRFHVWRDVVKMRGFIESGKMPTKRHQKTMVSAPQAKMDF